MYGVGLERFAREAGACGHDQLTPSHLWERFEDLSARRDAVQSKLDQHLPEVKSRSLMQADLIAQLVRSRIGR